MRTHKYKAWDRINGDWIRLYRVSFALDGSALAVHDIDGEMYGLHQVDLVQYTGLKDKNGTEIYEGDVLAPMSNDEEPVFRGNWEVIFKDGAFFGQGIDDEIQTWLPYWWPDSEIEVIGNIYENGDLLK